jgi:hypothetical protein
VDMPKILGLIWTYEHLTVFYMTWSTKGKVWSCSGTWALSGVHCMAVEILRVLSI